MAGPTVVDAPAPPPTTDGQDCWRQEGGTWIRVHVKPRKALFTPAGTRGGPLPETLSSKRRTEMVFLQGDKLEPDQLAKHSATDEWQASGTYRVMERTWTGTTIFETKVVAESRIALPSIECIEVQIKRLEEKQAEAAFLLGPA